ncbi:MAG: Wzz/FepE/Etk N-terminal domain-containing protein [Candidatus Zophobacter franzmannii]|nr:Wzz/FepE/Etk N-terminal domain-containing protein [Candidatus Zophobacter franzmannii]
MDNKKLVDYLLILAKKKWKIILWTSLFAIISIFIALLLPKYWMSKTSFTMNDSNSLGSSLPKNITSMIGNSMLGSLTSSGEGQKFLNLMSSRSFKEEVINEFDLKTYFKVEEADSYKALDQALLKLRKIVSVNMSDKTGVISIRCETKDKQLSVDMCNYYRNQTLKKIETQNKDKSRVEYKFLEARLAEYNVQYDSLLLQIKEFQQSNNMISLEHQQQILLQTYSEMVANSMKNELELLIIEKNYSKKSPEYQRMLLENEFLGEQIRDFESDKGLKNAKYAIGLSKIPNLTEKYAKLYLDSMILEKITSSLYPMLEASRYEFLKDKDYINIIDQPRQAGLRSKPKRAKLVVITTILSFLLISWISILLASMKSEDRLKWQAFWKQLWNLH